MKAKQLFISLILGLGLTLALLWLLGGSTPSVHADGPHYVAPDCTGVPAPCHTSIQEAVDAAVPGDEILVAGGTYTDVNVRPRDDITTTGVVTQVVYISKTVTIRGGYKADFSAWDPDTYSTTLDAQGRGRGLYVTGAPSASSGQAISPTIEGLRITGGNADDLGGGVYVISATATLSNNQVFSNTASFGGGGLLLGYSDATLSGNTVSSNIGGGLLLAYSDATLNGNTIISNTAYSESDGGGLCLEYSHATLNGNTIISNTALRGGGLYLGSSDATLSGNTVNGNTASLGGGLHLSNSAATLRDNTVSGNTGDGLCLEYSAATLSGNTVISNTALRGGGLELFESDAMLSGNIVSGNTAHQSGGGLSLYESDATLSGNIVSGNTANGTDWWGNGGGLYLGYSDITLTNNVIVDNRANTAGCGLYIAGSSPRLLYTTIARNSGGDGSGIHMTNGSNVVLTNTILVSHTVGISVAAGNTATLTATLWGTDTWANDSDWGGEGIVITGTRNYWDAPAFVDADTGDYHIGLTSAAIDKGVDGGVDEDIDRDPRPMGHGYDLGADELRIALTVTKQATPDPVQAGAQLTYTIHVANTGNVTLTATITDTLPEHVTTTQPLVWASQVLPAPGGVWAEMVVVTVEVGYIGPLTNVVQVTTEEGATGVYTETSASGYEIYLPLIMRQYP